jgi:hypothetical protein
VAVFSAPNGQQHAVAGTQLALSGACACAGSAAAQLVCSLLACMVHLPAGGRQPCHHMVALAQRRQQCACHRKDAACPAPPGRCIGSTGQQSMVTDMCVCVSMCVCVCVCIHRTNTSHNVTHCNTSNTVLPSSCAVRLVLSPHHDSITLLVPYPSRRCACIPFPPLYAIANLRPSPLKP